MLFFDDLPEPIQPKFFLFPRFSVEPEGSLLRKEDKYILPGTAFIDKVVSFFVYDFEYFIKVDRLWWLLAFTSTNEDHALLRNDLKES